MPVVVLAATLIAATDPSPWLEEAWAAHPDVQRAEASLERARAERAAAGVWLANPAVRVGLASDVIDGNEGELDFDVGVQQELRWPGTRLDLMRAGDASIESARARLALARLRVAADVEEALADVVAARAARTAWDELVVLAQTLDTIAQRKLDAGSIGALDAALASADAARTESQALEARAAIAAAEARLCNALARAPCTLDDTAALMWPALAALPADDASARLDVAAAQHETAAASARVDAAALAWLPTLQLQLGYSFERGVLHVPGNARHVIDEDQLLAAQVQLALPVWDWRRNDVHAARADALDAEASVRAAALVQGGAVRAARAAWDAAEAAATRLDAVQPRVTAALADLTRAVDAGALSLDDALTTRDRLLQTRLAAIDAQRRRAAAHAALLRVLAQDAPRPSAEPAPPDGADVRADEPQPARKETP